MSRRNLGNGVRKSVSEGARAFLDNEVGKIQEAMSDKYPEPVAVEYLDALIWIEKLLEACDDET